SQLSLVGIYLSLLVGLFLLLPMKSNTVHTSRSQTGHAADRSAGSGMADRRSDDAAGRGTAQGADTRALFARGQTTSSATDRCQKGRKSVVYGRRRHGRGRLGQQQRHQAPARADASNGTSRRG